MFHQNAIFNKRDQSELWFSIYVKKARRHYKTDKEVKQCVD